MKSVRSKIKEISRTSSITFSVSFDIEVNVRRKVISLIYDRTFHILTIPISFKLNDKIREIINEIS